MELQVINIFSFFTIIFTGLMLFLTIPYIVASFEIATNRSLMHFYLCDSYASIDNNNGKDIGLGKC